jgi:hypothetical protein
VGKMLLNVLHATENGFVTWRVNRYDKFHYWLTLRNFYSYYNLHQPPPSSVDTNTEARASTIKDYDSLHVEIFSATFCKQIF